MTLDPDLQRIYSAADQTINQLDQLHAASQARKTDWLAQLRAKVAGLDQFGPPEDAGTPAEPAERRDRDDARHGPVQAREPFVQLPQRVTHGGDYGPKVKDKLTRIALGEERGW